MTVADQHVWTHRDGEDVWVSLRVWLRDYADPTAWTPRHPQAGGAQAFYVRGVEDVRPSPSPTVALRGAYANTIVLYWCAISGRFILALPARIPVRWEIDFTCVREAVA